MSTARWLVMVGWGVGVYPLNAAAQEFRNPRDLNLPATQFQMPDTARSRVDLQNGLTAFVIDDRNSPLVSFTALVRGGTADDEREGAAEMLALMLATRGPCWMAPGGFREALDEMAARFRVVMGPEMTRISLNVSADDAMRGLRIFSGVVRETCIDEQGLAAFRTAVRQSAPILAEDGTVRDGSLGAAVRLFKQHLYGDHPYGRRVTVEDAAALTVEDVEEYHRDFFLPINVTLAVAGDFRTREMVAAVDQRFADWEARRPFFRRAPGLDAPDSRQEYRYRTDKLQSWIVMGHELPPVDPVDWPALEVMNYILGGGHFDTRLFREARDKRGLTNDASGFLERYVRGPGTYTFRTSGRPEVAEELIEIVFAEIDRIRSEPVSEEELTVARNALADGNFALLFENGHAAAQTFAREWTQEVSMVHLARYQRRIRNVSVRDVQRAAERYLKPERMIVVVVGPESDASDVGPSDR